MARRGRPPKNDPKAISCLASRLLEEKFQAAVEAVKGAEYKSLAAASLAFGIDKSSYTTLRRRVKGTHRSRREAAESRQLLTGAQERVLREWICWKAKVGQPLSKTLVRLRARIIAALPKSPSEKWLNAFLKRQNLDLGRPCGLDPKRAGRSNAAGQEDKSTESVSNHSMKPSS